MSVRGRKYRRRAGGAEKIKDNKRQSDKVMFGFGRFVLYGGLLSFLLLAAGCIGEETPSPEESTLVGVGEMAPDFTVEMFDGSEVRLSELRGRVVLLTFFASWCPECRDELSVVQRQVLDRFSGDDFSFLCIWIYITFIISISIISFLKIHINHLLRIYVLFIVFLNPSILTGY